MSNHAAEALALWGLEGATSELVAQRENEIWSVTYGTRRLALRFHRPGYRTEAELASELAWMQMLAQAGLRVPEPVARPDGSLFGRIGETNVSLLTWLNGQPIGVSGQLTDASDPFRLAMAVGAQMARLHDLTDAWVPPSAFKRPIWQAQELLGPDPLWGRFWEHPNLSPDDKRLLLDVRDAASADLDQLSSSLDTGLIHADLLAENVMLDGDQIAFIDFDDGAFGYRDFELATFLIKFLRQPYFKDLRDGLVIGYAVRRDIHPQVLDLMLLIRALTYPGWIITRLHEPGGVARSGRMLDTALTLARAYLEERNP